MDKNLNIKCRVILTKVGAYYLNKFHENKIEEVKHIFQGLQATPSQITQIFCTSYKEGDILELPLWEIFGKFGRYFEVYTEAAFVDNKIEFLE